MCDKMCDNQVECDYRQILKIQLYACNMPVAILM